MMSIQRRSTTSTALLWLSLLTGCTTLPVKTPSLASLLPSSTEPTQVVLTVQPSVLQEAGIPKHTGMMCRAYFFAGKDPAPIKVAGDWTFIAYEEPEGSPDKPQGLYRVADKEMENHYRKDVVGDSYVFWFPYETSEAVQLQLRGTLKLAGGRELTSTWVKMKLDPAQGGKNLPPSATSTSKNPSEPASAEGTAPPVHSTEGASPPSAKK